jgi:hypothetical protein
MIGIIEIDTNGAGTFKMVDHEGNDRGTLAAAVDGSGRIQIGKTTAQYRLADVAVEEGIYLGEQMIITGWMDDPISFHKTNPSKSLTLGDTSWINPRGLPVTYIFNKDGSFRIDLGPQVQAANDALWNADTEGTYTINGIEVTLNYPNGKALKWTKASDGGINGGMEQTASQQIFIEGACSKTPEMIEKARET